MAEDPFRDGVAINLWSIIEVTIAISCASVSAMKPLFSSKQRRLTRKLKSSSSGTASRNTAKYMQSNASNGPRQRARLASIDESSVKGLGNLTLVSAAGDEPESWAVPESLRQPPPMTAGSSGHSQTEWENMELSFITSGPETKGTGLEQGGKSSRGWAARK
jgi:hypothetical protein